MFQTTNQNMLYVRDSWVVVQKTTWGFTSESDERDSTEDHGDWSCKIAAFNQQKNAIGAAKLEI